MNVFFSGSGPDVDDRLIAAAPEHYRLCSCHGSYLKVAHSTVKDIIGAGYGKRCEIMLDSGAFTAWSKGDEVTLDHLIPVYSQFVDEYEPHLKAIWLINLDKIPGEKGRTAAPHELVEAMKIGDDNFEVLKEKFAHRVLPVFHQNEPQKQLLTLANASKYICISPRNDLPENSRVSWSQEVHRLIPGVKTHGLATTGAHMMASVPWGSVDSATWLSIGAYGGIAYETEKRISIITISKESQSNKIFDGHFDSVPPIFQEAIRKRIEEYGFDVDTLREDHTSRKLFSRIAIIKYAQRYADKQRKISVPVQEGLFDL